jgi:hypothetical protein
LREHSSSPRVAVAHLSDFEDEATLIALGTIENHERARYENPSEFTFSTKVIFCSKFSMLTCGSPTRSVLARAAAMQRKFDTAQVHELLYQAIETERGGIKIYTAAIKPPSIRI